MSKLLRYTIESNDENDYSTIRTCLPTPATQYTKLTVTALTTQCSIVVLNDTDYITINGQQYFIKTDYAGLSSESLVAILNDLLYGSGIVINLSITEQLISTTNGECVIEAATYNMKQITGLYNTELPLKFTDKFIVPSVGFYLSTPILYLLCNLGSPIFKSKGENCSNQ
jgi:hypothetical protein